MPCFAKWVLMLLVAFCLWESDVCQSPRIPVFSSTCIQQISRSTSRLLLVLLITHGQSTAVVSKYPQIHSVAGAGRLEHREDTWLVIEVPASVEFSWDTVPALVTQTQKVRARNPVCWRESLSTKVRSGTRPSLRRVASK